jgi:AbrB family looped-hinge helix DNA binding protein
MTTTLSIDKAGRVVIPQAIRKMFGFNPGALLKIEITEEAVVLKPAEQRSPLKRINGVLVFMGESTAPPEAFLNAIEEDREERMAHIWGTPL